MSRLGSPSVVALSALGVGVLAWPDLGLLARHLTARAAAAGLVALLVLALADRRTPRRVLAAGVAVAALGLGYDALRGERGTLTLVPDRPARTFEVPGGNQGLAARPLAQALVLVGVEADGTAVLAEGTAGRRVRVSAARAADLDAHRVGKPRRTAVAAAPGNGRPGDAVELIVAREPAALVAALGLLVAMVGVAWSRW